MGILGTPTQACWIRYSPWFQETHQEMQEAWEPLPGLEKHVCGDSSEACKKGSLALFPVLFPGGLVPRAGSRLGSARASGSQHEFCFLIRSGATAWVSLCKYAKGNILGGKPFTLTLMSQGSGQARCLFHQQLPGR